MLRPALLASGTAMLLLAALPALGSGRIPGSGGLTALPDAQLQMQRKLRTTPRPASPYPMNYSEQVASSLGLRDGAVALYDAREAARGSYAPSVSLGGTMIRLRWRQ